MAGASSGSAPALRAGSGGTGIADADIDGVGAHYWRPPEVGPWW